MRQIPLAVGCARVLCAALVFVAMRPATAQNLLMNPGFDRVGPAGPSTTFTGQGYAGPSAAADWTVYTNHYGTISTNLLPGLIPCWGRHSIRVTTTAPWSGLVQKFLPYDTGPDHAVALALVYVIRGKMGIGTGNGGGTPSNDAVSQKTNAWELLVAPNGGSPANEITVYALSPGGADFVVASTAVFAVDWDTLRLLVRLNVCKHGVAKSLCAKIDAAEAAEARGDMETMDAILQAFIHEVEAQNGKSIAPMGAYAMIVVANAM